MSEEKYKKDDFDELKDLLMKVEKQQIQSIEKRLDDPMIRAKEISEALPDAISLSLLSDNQISRVLQPVIDDSIKISVKNKPRTIADAISPALGPGIRKAITSTIMGMIQSLNHVLNHSFSVQGIKWRFEAFKSHKQFSEIVLLNTLVYQVEQIFLIHIKTGIVLEHVVAQDIISQDPDLVSGMLTAVQDFVKDSFGNDDTNIGEKIETLRMGSDRTIWIENGEHAMIAAVIRGTPPLDLRTRYSKLLEEIHIKSGMALENFDGDTLPFSIFRERLKDCLEFKEKKEQKKTSILLVFIFVVLLLALGMWGISVFKTHKAWHNYLSLLNKQKGVIILSAKKQDGRYQIYGLCDPMVESSLLSLNKKENQKVIVTEHWKNYYSLEPEFVLKRAKMILKPPSTIDLKLNGRTLVAMGEADNAWIENFQKTAPAIPGIDGINYKFVRNIDRKNMDIVLKKLVKMRIYFRSNSTKFIKGQEKILTKLVKIVQNIQKLQHRLKIPVEILIMGHTDSSGSERLNRRLSRDRARKIFSFLIMKGINPAFLSTSGFSNKIMLAKENTVNDRQYNRAITFKVFYDNSEQDNKIKTGQ